MVFGEAECRKLLKEEGHLVEVIWPDVTAELVTSRALYVSPVMLQTCIEASTLPLYERRQSLPSGSADVGMGLACVEADTLYFHTRACWVSASIYAGPRPASTDFVGTL